MSDDDEESTSGSQSTLFGSVKSSKSSASFFGSCKSTGLCKEYLFKFFKNFYLYFQMIFFSDTIGSFHTAYSTSNQSNATGGGRSGATFFGSCKSTGKVKIVFVEEKKIAMKELNNVWTILIIILILQIQ